MLSILLIEENPSTIEMAKRAFSDTEKYTLTIRSDYADAVQSLQHGKRARVDDEYVTSLARMRMGNPQEAQRLFNKYYATIPSAWDVVLLGEMKEAGSCLLAVAWGSGNKVSLLKPEHTEEEMRELLATAHGVSTVFW